MSSLLMCFDWLILCPGLGPTGHTWLAGTLHPSAWGHFSAKEERKKWFFPLLGDRTSLDERIIHSTSIENLT